MMTYRAFILHMCIPWDKTVPFVSRSRSLAKVMVKYQGHIKKNGGKKKKKKHLP